MDLSRNLLDHLPDKLFYNLDNLRELYLHENFISRLTDSFSRDVFNVKKLDLSHNELEVISPSSLGNLSSLEDLNLGVNSLVELNGKEFSTMTSLKKLNLEKNKLKSIAIDTFAENKNLKHLQLNDNSLKDVCVWEMLTNVTITIGKNPWNCDCDFIRQMIRMIEENKLQVKDTFDLYCEENIDDLKKKSPKYLLNPLEFCDGYIQFNGQVNEMMGSTTDMVYDDTTMMNERMDEDWSKSEDESANEII